MYLPSSTYRLQVNSSFPLKRIKELIPYLKQLGISTLYSAPFFAAQPGSTHGYDGINPEIINPEIGTLEEFKEIGALLKAKGMGWIQDIVPNHMAYHPDNIWLMDVFEKGPHSHYAPFFDIDWCHPDPSLQAKVLAPFLGEEPEELIKKGEFRFVYADGRFYAQCYALRYPLSWISYYDLLSGLQSERKLDTLLAQLAAIKNNTDKESFAVSTSSLEQALKNAFSTDSSLQASLETHLKGFNQELELFLSILKQQYFKLSYYTQSDTLINFRRFFVVDQLICLRIEDKNVFDRYHKFTKELVDAKLIDGLRIDHIDGLYDPKKYLENLRELVGENSYIVVEKILDCDEQMPTDWPIEGTSGYEFLSAVNQLFTKKEHKEQFLKIYKDFTGDCPDYEELVREKKSFMLKKRMGGELDNLLALLLETDMKDKVIEKQRWKECLFELLVSFPVYRTYIDWDNYSECDQGVTRLAFMKAREKNIHLDTEWSLLESLFSEEGLKNDANRRFLMRLQQFTGPLAAKGVEDTVFYIYNRLISHNEVGDSPRSFGLSTEEFHERMKTRQTKMPFSINALSTHDTKRGEDARARINVLSEMPGAWASEVFKWKELNKRHKTIKDGTEMPVANDEYFIYQSLLGSFPMEGASTEGFEKRLKEFMLKALREAKVYTDYMDCNTEYEEATVNFVENILHDPAFMEAFLPFFTKVSNQAIIPSLAQTLVKNTAPGIPDTYQGSELWELSLVDPDNRREIDFKERARLQEEICQAKDTSTLLKNMLENKRDARLKFYLTWHSLQARLQYKEVFLQGEYLPLTCTFEKQAQLVGYARQFQGKWMVTVIPREIIALCNDTSLPLGEEVWMGTTLHFPAEAPSKWKNTLTGQEYELISGGLLVSEVLKYFPVALLENM